MGFMSAAVGADVESICRKCGDVWHVVVAKVGDEIAKVQCKECGSMHRHRPPGGKAKKSGVSRRRAASSSSRATTGRAKAEPAPPAHEPTVEPDLSAPIRSYSIRDAFAVGERIDHPKFGIGIVEDVSAPGKMQVFFPSGRKVLAAAKPESRLGSLGTGGPAWLGEESAE